MRVPYNEHHLDLFASGAFRELTTSVPMSRFKLSDEDGLSMNLTHIEVFERMEYRSQGMLRKYIYVYMRICVRYKT